MASAGSRKKTTKNIFGKVIRKRKRRKAKNTSIGKKRKETISGRRRKRSAYLLSYILVAVVVMIIITVLSLTVLFKIEQVDIAGNQKYTNAEITRVSGVTTGDNLFRVKTRRLEELIETQLPYVENVEIKRRIPSTLRIEITEAQPAFVINDSELLMILSKNFKVLEPLNGDIPSELVLIKGMAVKKCTVGYQIEFENAEAERNLHAIIMALTGNSFNVRAIEFTESGILRLNYDERIIIDMGGPVNLDHKVKMAKNVIENELAVTDRGILYISGDNLTSFRLDTGSLKLDYLINKPKQQTPAPETPEETPAA